MSLLLLLLLLLSLALPPTTKDFRRVSRRGFCDTLACFPARAIVRFPSVSGLIFLPH